MLRGIDETHPAGSCFCVVAFCPQYAYQWDLYRARRAFLPTPLIGCRTVGYHRQGLRHDMMHRNCSALGLLLPRPQIGLEHHTTPANHSGDSFFPLLPLFLLSQISARPGDREICTCSGRADHVRSKGWLLVHPLANRLRCRTGLVSPEVHGRHTHTI